MAIEDILANPYVAPIPQQIAAGRQAAQQNRLTDLQIQQAEAAMKPKEPSLGLDDLPKFGRVAFRRAQGVEDDQSYQIYRNWVAKTAGSDMASQLPEEYDPEALGEFATQAAVMSDPTSDYGKTLEEARIAVQMGDVGAAQNALGRLEKLSSETNTRDLKTFYNPETGDVRTVRAGDMETIDSLIGGGYYEGKGPQRVEQGGPGAFDKVTQRNLDEVETAGKTAVSEIDNLINQLRERGDSSVGVVGGLVRFAESTASQVKAATEVLGGSAFVDGERVEEQQLIDPGLYEDVIDDYSELAGASARIKSNYVNLAYALARAANPDGRLSDADVRMQLEALASGSGSTNQMINVLQEAKRRTIDGTRIAMEVRGREVDFGEQAPAETEEADDFSNLSTEELLNRATQ